MVSYRILQVDITAHRNREGRVLLPAEPWGVAFLGFDSAEEELIETGSASKKRRAEAELSARQWIERTPGRMALVFSRKTGVVVAQYYRDREGISWIAGVFPDWCHHRAGSTTSVRQRGGDLPDERE